MPSLASTTWVLARVQALEVGEPMRKVMRLLRRFRHQEDATAAAAEKPSQPEPTFHFEFESVEGQLIYPSELPPPPGFNGNGAGAAAADEEIHAQ